MMVKRLNTGAEYKVYESCHPGEKFLLYFHGGGLIYGTKDDIPSKLVKIFNEAQFDVITLDYLLAPNSSLYEIFQNLLMSVIELKNEVIKDNPYSLFGRSAGGYLVNLLVKYFISENHELPRKIINFYSYYDLEFYHKNELKDMEEIKITRKDISDINLKEEIWDDPYLQRVLVFKYAVQNNLMGSSLGLFKEDYEKFSVSKEEFKKFPPTFLSASTTDQEVPYYYSKNMSKWIPNSCFKPAYYLEHDFLANQENEQVSSILKDLKKWISL